MMLKKLVPLNFVKNNSFKIQLKKGEGINVWDTDNKKYIDCLTPPAYLPLGHNNHNYKLTISNSLKKNKIIQAPLLSENINFLQLIKTILPTNFANNSKFIHCSRNPVDNAIKIAKNVTKRDHVMFFEGSSHSLIEKYRYSKIDLYNMELNQPVPYFGTPYQDYKKNVNFIDYRISNAELKPAAIVVEPLHFDNGVHLHPIEWMRDINEIAHKHGIIFILDERNTGFSKTGQNFYFDENGINPDIVCLSENIGTNYPFHLLCFKTELENKKNCFKDVEFYQGNQLALKLGINLIEHLVRNNMNDHMLNIKSKININMNYLKNCYGNLIVDRRIYGSSNAIEFENNEKSKNLVLNIQKNAVENGLLFQTAGKNDQIIKLSFPLIIENQDIDEIFSKLDKSLQKALFQ